MYISEIGLYQFRNYDNINIKLHPKLNILYGNNAQGKTNILEAIYICATARSHRTSREKEAIKWEKEEAHIRLFLNKESRIEKIDFHLNKNGKKYVFINEIPVQKLSNLLGIMNIVMFSPEDLQLIKSGPKERRRFLDIELCQIDKIYLYNLQQYYKVLKQRNHLLKSIHLDKGQEAMLEVWDEQLVYFGEKIIESRRDFVNKISNIASMIHANITSNKENLSIEYSPNVKKEIFKDKLKDSLDKDIKTGISSVGPHRDDILFKINNNDVRTYGSQGQQRSVILSLKLAEIDLIKKEINDNPILLLDDVLSELDENRQADLLSNIDNIQTIITCTGIEDLILKKLHKGFLFHIENGFVEPQDSKFL
ncbi:MAG: DNA replication/repair protein RecF [Epulopiscium sp.]|jgi:DNA replication and repair protein RecF|nr:DNA replication/repair protein RecF [Candidatus Epulonipiscium sp.]